MNKPEARHQRRHLTAELAAIPSTQDGSVCVQCGGIKKDHHRTEYRLEGSGFVCLRAEHQALINEFIEGATK